ncbi:helix-turn-helix transcriptional regulator [Pseudomonas graminis]|uniref:helix-turn-helix domain-containing protein n=1 Tax=Pseudomonas graminis TaxID=158627 RepID=UPI00234B7577|nr:helix-turn-helix transcriptional regulator [Pseudomonas graminis]MDC6379920.1 helix-turn-helix transcriptional regulator [Pseudomonas graminis]
MSIFSVRLKQARKAAGLSQERLGVLAGIEEASASARMSQYEKGKHEPGEGMVKQIALACGLPVAFFFCEQDDEAELLVLFHKLKKAQRGEVLAAVRLQTGA